MLGTCPHCRARLELPRNGQYVCDHCRRAFHYYQAPVHTAAAAVAMPAPAVTDTPCALHPNNQAAGTCERCGDFICALCATPTEGRTYCTRCFDLLYQRGALQMAQRPFTLPGNALTLAVFSLPAMLLYGLGLVTAVIAMILGVSALRQISARPDLPGRARAISAIVIASLALMASVILVVYILKGGIWD